MTAGDISRLLAQRHAKDLFATEVLCGPAGSRRLDAWAMRRSWSRAMTYGYEIKVSRSDWLSDHKWHEARPFVGQMWIAAVSGVVEIEELPAGVGLLVPASTGSRLLTKRKAAPATAWDDAKILRALAINRVRSSHITADRWEIDDDSAASWRAWLERRDAESDLGRACSRKISRLVRERIARVETENIRLAREIEDLQSLRTRLDRLGISPSSMKYHTDQQLRAALLGDALVAAPNLDIDLARVVEQIGRLRGMIAEARTAGEEG